VVQCYLNNLEHRYEDYNSDGDVDINCKEMKEIAVFISILYIFCNILIDNSVF